MNTENRDEHPNGPIKATSPETPVETLGRQLREQINSLDAATYAYAQSVERLRALLAHDPATPRSKAID